MWASLGPGKERGVPHTLYLPDAGKQALLRALCLPGQGQSSFILIESSPGNAVSSSFKAGRKQKKEWLWGMGNYGRKTFFLNFYLKRELEIYKGEFMNRNAESSIEYLCIPKFYARGLQKVFAKI